MKRRDFIGISILSASAAPSIVSAKERKREKKKYFKVTEADVVVVGAGPAGIPAAIAAARNGSKVVLLEEDQLIGGAPVDMFVSFPCGGPQNIGIFSEIRKKVMEKYDISGGKPYALWFFPSTYALVLSEMVAKEKNIELISGAHVCGAIMDENSPSKIAGVEYCAGVRLTGAVKGKVVIDATGSGELSVMAGAKYMFGRESKSDFGEKYAPEKGDKKVQPCTLMGYLQKFDDKAEVDIVKLLKSEAMMKKLIARSGVGFAKRIDESNLHGVNQFLMWTAAKPCDTRDSTSVARAMSKVVNEIIPELTDLFWKAGFALHTAPKIGIRESRRIVGDKIITSDELMQKELPEDVISRGVYRIDSWGRKLPQELHKSLSFGIPYRATIVKGIDNLMMAGKHISGTSLAMSAYRVQPILCGMGQAVGLAASIAAASGTNPRDIDVKDLQKRLSSQGILPKEYA